MEVVCREQEEGTEETEETGSVLLQGTWRWSAGNRRKEQKKLKKQKKLKEQSRTEQKNLHQQVKQEVGMVEETAVTQQITP